MIRSSFFTTSGDGRRGGGAGRFHQEMSEEALHTSSTQNKLLVRTLTRVEETEKREILVPLQLLLGWFKLTSCWE